MTPMKRYADQFRRLDQVLGRVQIARWMQNGHEPHYNPMSWQQGCDSQSKGVKADCLYVYQEKAHRVRYGERQVSPVSFGFSFYYQTPEQAQVILFSCKIGKKLYYSMPYLVSEFSPILKSIIAFVEAINFKGSAPHEQEGYLTEIAEHMLKMMGTPNDVRARRESADERVLDVLKTETARLDLAEHNEKEASSRLSDAQQRVRNRVSRTKVYKEVLDLKRQLEYKMAELNQREALIMQEEGVPQAEADFKQSGRDEMDVCTAVHQALVDLAGGQDAMMASASTRKAVEDQVHEIEKMSPSLRRRR